MNQKSVYGEFASSDQERIYPSFSESTPHGSREAIIHLQTSLKQGKDWTTSLLEAMGLWTLTEEVLGSYIYRYLIQSEAFDWQLLASRLLKEVEHNQIPDKEVWKLQRTGMFPREILVHELRHCLGGVKFQAYLNYWYGITVESAIQLAVQEELRKDRLSKGFVSRKGLLNEVFMRLYNDKKIPLYNRFKQQHAPILHRADNAAKYKEFTYWLFKIRLGLFDGARIASDTCKGLEWLQK